MGEVARPKRGALGQIKLAAGSLKRVHVNQHLLKRRTATGEPLPVYTVKCGGKTYPGQQVAICGVSWLPEPGAPLACGARCWVETKAEVWIDESSRYREQGVVGPCEAVPGPG